MKRISLFVLAIILLLISACSTEHTLVVDTTSTIYLPLIAKPYNKPIVGVEVYHASWEQMEPLYRGDVLKVAMHITKVPLVSNIYDWSFYDNVIGNHDLLYLGFRGRDAEPICKFPLDFQSWLNWVLAGIEHYNPDYVVFWNEPDTSEQWAAFYLGCIGSDYASGVLYGVYFNEFYQTVKAAYPGVTVLAGELINPYTEFTLGMLDTIERADGISLHYYAWCDTDYETNVANLITKLRSLTSLPLYLSETSAIYRGSEIVPSCEVYKSEYVEWVMGQDQFEMVVFFTLNNNGWLHSWLEDNPAYYVYAER